VTRGREQLADLGLIIPTREEFEYVRRSISFAPAHDEDGGFWYDFEIPGGRLGVAHVLFDMGLTAATAAASRLLTRFGPRVLAVIGIGGALSADLRLGDVVVASVIQEYLKEAKVAPDGSSRTAFVPAGSAWPVAERLRGFTNNFQYIDQDHYAAWRCGAVARATDARLPVAATPGARDEPECFVLPVASGDLVVADPAFRDWLLSHDRKLAVVEMEAAGAARAVREHDQDVGLLVLRGISDFADERKAALDAVAGVGRRATGAWRRYAAQNAIELLLAFLASPRFPWTRPARAVDAGPSSGSVPGTADVTVDSHEPAPRQVGKYVIDVRGAQGVQIGDGNQQHVVFRPRPDAEPGRP
jgi:nucleoside phosphorylase